MFKYNIEQIEKLRIHELRDFARSLGIHSPTTMKKTPLIDKIRELMGDNSGNGGLISDEPINYWDILVSDNQDAVSNLMRISESKEIKDNDENNDSNKTIVIKKSTISLPSTPYVTSESSPFSLNISQNSAPYSNEIEMSEGYIYVDVRGYGIVRSKNYTSSPNDSCITAAMIKKYGLRTGNYVRGKVRTLINGKPKIMYEIDETDVSQNRFNRIFDDMVYNPLKEKLFLGDYEYELFKGGREYISGLSLQEVVDFSKFLTDENGASVKIVNFKAIPEQSFDSEQKLEIINLPFNLSATDVVDSIRLIAERMKREYEFGKPNVLILNNFSGLIRIFDVAAEDVYSLDSVSSKAVNEILNILYLAKISSPDNFLTVLCVDSTNIPRNIRSILDYEIMPILHKA